MPKVASPSVGCLLTFAFGLTPVGAVNDAIRGPSTVVPLPPSRVLTCNLPPGLDKAVQSHLESGLFCLAAAGRKLFGGEPVQRRTARLKEDCAV
jgi:hypothetical protein